MSKAKYVMHELSIEITYKCNLNCIHCSSRAGQDDTMISYNKIIEIIDDCKENCGTTSVSLSGGEPFLHEKFWRILDYIKYREMESLVYTCGVQEYDIGDRRFGSFSDGRIMHLKNLDCGKLIVSLHGKRETHNKIMNIDDDAFGYAVETIKKAIKEGIRTEIHFVPMNFNYQDLLYICLLCMKIGVSRVSVLRFVPQGRGIENNQNLDLTKEQFLELNRSMKWIRDVLEMDDLGMDLRLGCPVDFTFLFGDNNWVKRKPCGGGKTNILIKATGDVQTCPAWKELTHLSAGNIYHQKVSDIWDHSPVYQAFRSLSPEMLAEPCGSCRYVNSCLGGCTAQRILFTTKDLNGIWCAPDPLCFLKLLEDKDGE